MKQSCLKRMKLTILDRLPRIRIAPNCPETDPESIHSWARSSTVAVRNVIHSKYCGRHSHGRGGNFECSFYCWLSERKWYGTWLGSIRTLRPSYVFGKVTRPATLESRSRRERELACRSYTPLPLKYCRTSGVQPRCCEDWSCSRRT